MIHCVPAEEPAAQKVAATYLGPHRFLQSSLAWAPDHLSPVLRGKGITLLTFQVRKLRSKGEVSQLTAS